MSRKLIPTVLVAIFLLIVIIIFEYHHKQTSTDQSLEVNASNDWQAWNEDEYKIRYPQDFEVSKGESARGNLIGTPRVTLAFRRDAFPDPKSNFNEAYVTVASGSDPESVQNCYVNPNPNNPNGNFADRITLNGTEFRKGLSTDAAAGNIYTSEVYRTTHNGACYEIALTVHTGNIYNYPEGTVTEFEQERALSILRRIRDTFMFTK